MKFTEILAEVKNVIYPYIQEKYDFFSENKASFDSLGANLQVLIDVDNNKLNINAAKANEANINALASIKAVLETLNTNIESVRSAEANANDAKSFRDQTQILKEQTTVIAGGNVLSENVKFLDNKDLEEHRAEVTASLDAISLLLGSDDINLDSLQEIVFYIKENRTEMDEQTATLGDMIWKQNLVANNLKIEGVA